MTAMLSRHQDPIIAIATAPGRGAVGIVRVSGQHLKTWADAFCGKPLQARQAHYLPFNDDQGEPIDQGINWYNERGLPSNPGQNWLSDWTYSQVLGHIQGISACPTDLDSDGDTDVDDFLIFAPAFGTTCN
jgi:hypothetical protein